ncbi:hypothetical protein [Larsenimonas rhizosphaerae]|uniref:hypothetical protein n=1 Tax=Larsenimonas rhizosphaerae TaxID=2944682 RepID=UPI0020347FDA|nr:hypothetical protein [Larsenimonas rhizosphaerae]MCM2129625.1 hypothetical protein [Larsenimonas rhizosphaerae]
MRHFPCRLLVAALTFGPALPSMAETVIIERQHSISNQGQSAHHERDRRPHIEANVLIAPDTEHWRSNYVPDNYHLEDYDGTPNRSTICEGSGGRTLSTTDRPCPEGQSASGGTRYSTD